VSIESPRSWDQDLGLSAFCGETNGKQIIEITLLKYLSRVISARFDTLFSGLHFDADGILHTICVNGGIARPLNPG